MFWATAAIASAAINAIGAIIDSYMLTRRKVNLLAYLFTIGSSVIIISTTLLLIFPFPANARPEHIGAAFGTGILACTGALIMYHTIRKGEISRIIPVVSISPIFVALLAVIFLHETLGLRAWAGIIITVIGAALISIHPAEGNGKARLQKSFFLLLFAAFLFGVSQTVAKYALQSITFWNMFSLNSLAFSIMVLIYTLRKSTFRELSLMSKPKEVWALSTLNQLIIITGIILSYIAIQKGQVAVVSTITSSRPVFVFIYAVLLSRFLPNIIHERLTNRTASIKVLAIMLTIGGIALLML